MNADEALGLGGQALQRFEVVGDQPGVFLVTFTQTAFQMQAAGHEDHTD
ncbi:MAG TPA: hypothetical protein VEF72_07685 [Mycobacterium sp.]|nr:hypothetical protein [Mycobacterium sp.]